MRRSKTVFPCVYANTNFKNSFSFFIADLLKLKMKNIVIKLISPLSSEHFELS